MIVAEITLKAIPLLISLSVIIATGYLTWAYCHRRLKLPKKLLKHPNVKHELKLIEKRHISHNVRLFRFELPPNTCLGLEPGQHIYVSAHINGSLVVRTYSPVSSIHDTGFMDLIIKVYFRDTHENYPNGGKMSQFLNELKLGENVQVRGPAGRMVYKGGPGEFVIRGDNKSPAKVLRADKINMIAGGSGITPMLQILNTLFMDDPLTAASKSKVSLVYANQTEDDILCRTRLDEITRKYPERFKIWYTLSQPPTNWAFGKGRVTKDMFEKHLYPPDVDNLTICLICGPTPMVNFSCLPALLELRYEPSRCFVY